MADKKDDKKDLYCPVCGCMCDCRESSECGKPDPKCGCGCKSKSK